MLEVRGLVTGYATATVLRGVDLVVPEATEVGSTAPEYLVDGGVDPAYSNTPFAELKASV